MPRSGTRVLCYVSGWSGGGDPAGNQWTIATHVEDVGDEQVMERMKEMAPP